MSSEQQQDLDLEVPSSFIQHGPDLPVPRVPSSYHHPSVLKSYSQDHDLPVPRVPSSYHHPSVLKSYSQDHDLPVPRVPSSYHHPSVLKSYSQDHDPGTRHRERPERVQRWNEKQPHSTSIGKADRLREEKKRLMHTKETILREKDEQRHSTSISNVDSLLEQEHLKKCKHKRRKDGQRHSRSIRKVDNLPEKDGIDSTTLLEQWMIERERSNQYLRHAEEMILREKDEQRHSTSISNVDSLLEQEHLKKEWVLHGKDEQGHSTSIGLLNSLLEKKGVFSHDVFDKCPMQYLDQMKIQQKQKTARRANFSQFIILTTETNREACVPLQTTETANQSIETERNIEYWQLIKLTTETIREACVPLQTTETANQRLETDGMLPQPVFSEDWQFQESFSNTGRQLRGRNSDVILIVPEHAVRDASQESLSDVIELALPNVIMKKGYERSANINEAMFSEVSGQACGSDAKAHEINNDVIIRGAISIDLQRVHEKLHLGRCESVRSPVAEYFAGENFSFQKPVSISLPHFLPPGFSAADVRVYQFYRSSDGQILVNTLKLLKAENSADKHTASNTPGTSAEDVTATEGFYFTDDNRIQVVTSHFSGYLCTLCKKEMDPPHLRLRLYGKHVQRQSRDVDLTLFIWDLRLDIRDFRKAGLPNPEEEKTFQASQTLEPLDTSSIDNVQLGVHLRLPAQEGTIWMHLSSDGEPYLPPKRRIGIKKFVPCCLDTIPERVDWALLTRHDPGQLRWFECMLDVGYVTAAVGDVPLQFLPVPPMQTLRVRGLELLNEQRSATTQTDQHLMEDTHVKQLEGNFTSLRTTASSPHFSLPKTESGQGASAYHGQRQYVATASTPASHQGSSSSSDSVSNIPQASFSEGMAFSCSGVTMPNQARAASLEEQMSCPEQASLGDGMAAMSLNPGGAAPNYSRAAPVQEQNADMSFNPEGAMLNQTGAGPTQEQMSAMALNSPASALSPSRGHHVTRSGGEGDNSRKQVIYTNCTFNMQANKSTTNNNVGKLHDMNFGNTTNIATEGDRAEGGTPHHVTPPHHVTEPRIEFPDVAEVLQQSVAQQAENESLQ